jgi:hypothetical protein
MAQGGISAVCGYNNGEKRRLHDAII